MKALRRFWIRLVASIARRRDEERLKGEIKTHLGLQTAENIRAGMSPVEARRQAVLKFGAVEAVKEHYRDQRRLPLLENLGQDTRYALRGLARSPGVSLTAIIVLALALARIRRSSAWLTRCSSGRCRLLSAGQDATTG